MSKAVPSPLLIGIKQEEGASEEQYALSHLKANESDRANQLRLCSRFAPLREHGSSEKDELSIGSEWPPPPSPTSSTLSNEVKTVNLSASAASSLPADKSNTTSVVSSSINICSTVLVKAPKTSDIPIPKREREDDPVENYSNDLEGQRRLDPFSRQVERGRMCEFCAKAFTQASALSRHIDDVHNQLRRYACGFCGNTFSRNYLLKEHIDCVHKELRKCMCDICCRCFKWKSSMAHHIATAHRNPASRSIRREHTCEFCGKAFAQVGTLTRHVDSVHKRIRKFACEICGKDFYQKAHLKRHIDAIHKHIREHPCVLCGKAFVTRQHLNRHIGRMHPSTAVCPLTLPRSWFAVLLLS